MKPNVWFEYRASDNLVYITSEFEYKIENEFGK